MHLQLLSSASIKRAIATQLGFLWLGLILAIGLWLVVFFFSAEIETSTALTCILLLLAIPACITYVVMAIALLKRFRLKLLVLIPLALWPKIFLIIVSVGPFAYLVISTIIEARRNKED